MWWHRLTPELSRSRWAQRSVDAKDLQTCYNRRYHNVPRESALVNG